MHEWLYQFYSRYATWGLYLATYVAKSCAVLPKLLLKPVTIIMGPVTCSIIILKHPVIILIVKINERLQVVIIQLNITIWTSSILSVNSIYDRKTLSTITKPPPVFAQYLVDKLDPQPYTTSVNCILSPFAIIREKFQDNAENISK